MRRRQGDVRMKRNCGLPSQLEVNLLRLGGGNWAFHPRLSFRYSVSLRNRVSHLAAFDSSNGHYLILSELLPIIWKERTGKCSFKF